VELWMQKWFRAVSLWEIFWVEWTRDDVHHPGYKTSFIFGDFDSLFFSRTQRACR
jgi:hypothetical protein